MGLFRRRRREDEDEEDDEIEEKKPPKKKFKDLDPENARKRKPIKKPWGKKERFVIFIFFFGMAVTAAILAGSSRNWKFAGLPRLKISNPIPDTLVIEKPTPMPRTARDYSALEKQIQDIIFDLSGVYGVYVWDLEGGSGFGINENESMQAASLVKLPVMADIYKLAQDKDLSLSQKYVLQESDKVGGSGSLIGQPPGTSLTLRELVQYMGKQSDNTAFNIALNKIIGLEKAQNYTTSLGMVNTLLDPNENKTTPFEIGSFFRQLWSGGIVNETGKKEILNSLTDTVWEDWLPKYIEDVDVAHKYGRETHVINDAGIVFTNDPYVIVVMTDGIVESQATEALPKIIKMIHEFMKS
jgi:beta-lactamase class A